MPYKLLKIFLAIAILSSLASFSPTVAATNSPENCLELIEEKLENFIAIKGDPENSSPNKEIAAHEDLLKTIIQCSKEEVLNLENRLSQVKTNSKQEISVKEDFSLQIKNFIDYLNQKSADLENSEKNIDFLTQTSQSLLSWRQSVYYPTINNIIDFTLIDRQKEINSIASKRLERISSSIQSLDFIIKNKKITELISSVENKIISAKNDTTNAERLFYKKISPIEKQKEDIKEEKEEITLKEEAAKENKDEDIEGAEEITVRSLIKNALNNIKSSYDDFISISEKVRQLFRIS